ncbi:MAG: hypothetical protein LBD17_01195 [Endomicrobium sp.]|jgi:hypothetical protein|nr:hypothetical protein [Endomicrobium sp.]
MKKHCNRAAVSVAIMALCFFFCLDCHALTRSNSCPDLRSSDSWPLVGSFLHVLNKYNQLIGIAVDLNTGESVEYSMSDVEDAELAERRKLESLSLEAYICLKQSTPLSYY